MRLGLLFGIFFSFLKSLHASGVLSWVWGSGIAYTSYKRRVVTSRTTEVVSLHVVANSCICTMGPSVRSGQVLLLLVFKEVLDSPKQLQGASSGKF